jgi:hypothetical protein
MIEDINNRKIMEDELKKASLYNRTLIEASLDPLVTISRDKKIQIANKKDNQSILSSQSTKKIAIFSGVVVIFISILGLLAYIPELCLLGSIRSYYVPMAPSTAISFLLLSTILILHTLGFWRRGSRFYAITLSAIVSIYGFLILIEYIFGIDFSFEKAIFRINDNVSGIPIGIMSPYTGIMFFLSGIIMILGFQ